MESPDPPDWELLSSLFSRSGEHRHKMNLRRAGVAEFYAPTADGPEIRREKQAILAADGDRRMVVSGEGHRAAMEFARTLGLPSGADLLDSEPGWREYNRRLSLELEPDLLLVQPPAWSLVWANVCFPSRWSLEGKALRPLSWIHEAVPGLNAELGSKIATFFSRLIPGDGWRRANWGLSASPQRNQHPATPIRALGADCPPDRVFVRVEDQHLVKLRETGAIAFGIRIKSFAWTEVRQNAVIAAALLKRLRSMPADIALYKAVSDIFPPLPEKC